MICETVKIKAENEWGFVIINKDDYDESKHKLYTEPKKRRVKREQT